MKMHHLEYCNAVQVDNQKEGRVEETIDEEPLQEDPRRVLRNDSFQKPIEIVHDRSNKEEPSTTEDKQFSSQTFDDLT